MTTESVPGGRGGLERQMVGARKSFKPEKSRCLVLKKCRVVDKFCLSISEIPIPIILERPVKSLWKTATLGIQHPLKTPARSWRGV